MLAWESSSVGPASGNKLPRSVMLHNYLVLISRVEVITESTSVCHPFLLACAALPPNGTVTLGETTVPAFVVTLAV
jgi:hypothetical protein